MREPNENEKKVLVSFTADLHHCINHRCTAEIILSNDEAEELIEVNWWADGFTFEQYECPEAIWESIEASWTKL